MQITSPCIRQCWKLLTLGCALLWPIVASFPASSQAAGKMQEKQSEAGEEKAEHRAKQMNPAEVVTERSCEAACDQARNKGFDPSFQKNPPRVERVSVEELGTGENSRKAKLTVTFLKDSRLKESVAVRVGQQAATLKRISGTTFAGTVDFDFGEFESVVKQRAERLREVKELPVFENRLLTNRVKPSSFDISSRTRLIEINPAILRNFLGNPANIDPTRELMITDPSVVDDPARTFNPCTNSGVPLGIWTFGHLMTEMANQPVTGIDPSDFVLNWLNTYTVPQTLNGWTVAQRNIQGFINSWPKLANGKLDLSKAPFLLLAIVNRVDLRGSFTYGGGGNAGEARFVFGAVNPSGGCGTQPFTVIFEYGIKKSSCPQLHAWAQLWHNLGTMVLGSPVFNVTLQTITDQFTVAGADPSKPNGSALNQLRTNEIAFGGPWELREFHVAGQLQPVVVKQTPDTTLNNSATVRDYINANQAALLAGTNVVPLQFPLGTHFQGGSSIDHPDFWDGPATINNNDARQQFSVNTCNACHGRETATFFLQIAPRTTGGTASLSAFLTGETIPDPAVPATLRTYSDLLRRQQDLDTLLNSGCRTFGFLNDMFFRPLPMPH